MFQQYEPNVKATILFLKSLKVKVNNCTVNDTLQNHPDWPSLLCISDSLSNWNIPNGAGKINIKEIGQLPLPFLANIPNNENSLAIVTEISNTSIKYYHKNYHKLVFNFTIKHIMNLLKKFEQGMARNEFLHDVVYEYEMLEKFKRTKINIEVNDILKNLHPTSFCVI